LDITIADETIAYLAAVANGDARSALNALELAVQSSESKNGSIVVDRKSIEESLQRTHLLYDKGGEEHYNIISALHKSMRGNDPDAALYWLGRMLEGGEDPLYVARRLVRFASEDVGLADPQALPQAVAAYQASHFIGMPECGVVLAQCVAYLALAPKSIAVYDAYNHIQHDIREAPTDPVPLHIRNAPTKMMKELGYGKNYKYTPAFDTPEEAAQDYLPERLKGKTYLKWKKV
jgi:putative ATPase